MVRRDGKLHYIGTYDTPELADEAVRTFLEYYKA